MNCAVDGCKHKGEPVTVRGLLLCWKHRTGKLVFKRPDGAELYVENGRAIGWRLGKSGAPEEVAD